MVSAAGAASLVESGLVGSSGIVAAERLYEGVGTWAAERAGVVGALVVSFVFLLFLGPQGGVVGCVGCGLRSGWAVVRRVVVHKV